MTTTATEAELVAAKETITLLKESLADVQRAMDRDDFGWSLLGSSDETLTGFGHDFRKRAAARNVVAAAANPLIKRGMDLRAAYVWGNGVTISVDDKPDQGQDVNAVIQGFLDDPDNQATFATLQAHVEHENKLSTHGVVWFCLPTDPVTGRVRVRQLSAAQITKIYTDPEDESSEWLYLREWVTPDTQPHKAWYPRLGYRPAVRDQQVADGEDQVEVRWDQPVRPVMVNKVGQWGLGDLFAAVPWADAYKGFLEDWRAYMKSLVQFAWRVRTRGDKVGQAQAALVTAAQNGPGAGFGSDPNTYLEAISKSGATINADSGRPLAAMVAAALHLPVTTLLGDPGVTGARATAETVSDDSKPIYAVRREMWKSVIAEICGWVIDAAVIAPAGPLRGTIVRDGNRQTATLPEGDGRTVRVTFPDIDSTSVLEKVKSVQIVGQSELLPPLVLIRLYLEAYGVPNVDEVMDLVTDDQGNWIPPDLEGFGAQNLAANRGGVQPPPVRGDTNPNAIGTGQ